MGNDSLHGYQECDREIHDMMLSNTYVIPVLYTNPLIMILSLQKGFQLTSEVKDLIHIMTKNIFLTRKWITPAERFPLERQSLYEAKIFYSFGYLEAETVREGVHGSGRDRQQETG